MPQPPQSPFPPIPERPQNEGGRWRFHRPDSKSVAEWFATQPLDDGMQHEDFISGVVIIPQSEKVRHTRLDGQGTSERYEQVFTPYVQIGTRVGYARKLAEHRGLIYRPDPAQVPRSTNPASPYFNGHMEDGLWWHIVRGADGENLRYLCATWTVALYDPPSFAAKMRGDDPMPVIYGRGTKQVTGGPDPNGIMKAQTGAIGRALGVAGILVIGTGIATAEDMQELPGYGVAAPEQQTPTLPSVPSEIAQGEPPPVDATAELDQLRSRAQALLTQLQESAPDAHVEFMAWYTERAWQSGWKGINDVPFEALKGIVARLERQLAEATST